MHRQRSAGENLNGNKRTGNKTLRALLKRRWQQVADRQTEQLLPAVPIPRGRWRKRQLINHVHWRSCFYEPINGTDQLNVAVSAYIAAYKNMNKVWYCAD
ncbi:hypothetical protein KCP75_15325 [Salmonella enterica subsp. enterica]|nr:hypothetical protein KCP75_15325 [Salmonella enterica subsp. enterica]